MAHQSYNHDVGQPARQQSHDDHTGRDRRIAHDGHGCYDRTQWDVSVALAATASTAASCQHDPKFEAYLAWDLLTKINRACCNHFFTTSPAQPGWIPHSTGCGTPALVTSRDTDETQDEGCWSTDRASCPAKQPGRKLERRAHKPTARLGHAAVHSFPNRR